MLVQTNSPDCGYVDPFDLSSIMTDITSNVATYGPMNDGTVMGAARTELMLFKDGTWKAIWAYAPGAYRYRTGRWLVAGESATNFEFMVDNAMLLSTYDGKGERSQGGTTPTGIVGVWYPLGGATWSAPSIDGSTQYPTLKQAITTYYDTSDSYEGYNSSVFTQTRHTFRLNIRDKRTQQMKSINITMNAVGNSTGPRAGYTTTP